MISGDSRGLGPRDRAQLRRLLTWQGVFAVLAIALAAPFGATVVESAAIGAGVCLLANWVFALRVFRHYRAQAPTELALRIYAAEIVKIALILGLFALAFATLANLNLPALLGTYFAVQVLPALFASRPAQ
ncbi:ATP synthase subunit I [uncultured Thiohalocapsa sp.]|uniref:ATP synthase subunit I n=1 Tax=uncultured Thiohalocapsa sp. TaxID=768990 RepID=UPI002600D77F|nr:ATP synthase subunit I [uncultured Thiohalocapsa sp.]